VGELVDDVEHAELAPLMSALLDKIVGPHVVAALGSQPNARSVIQPQACPLGLPDGNLQPLASPDPLDPLVVDQPARPTQKLGDLAIAVIGHLAHPDRADRLRHALTLRGQNINLPQLGDDLFRLVTLPRHCGPPSEQNHSSGWTTSPGVDHLYRTAKSRHAST